MKLRNLKLDLSTPVVMGVLNVTPDSFSDGGRYGSLSAALKQIEKMVVEGALIIDVGGESTRPGSDSVPAEVERKRTQEVILEGVKKFPDTIFSIDTMKAEVADAALNAGAHLVNDVSGLKVDARKASLCANFGAGLVIMHTRGMPKTMQENPEYDDVVGEVHSFLIKQAGFAKNKGVESIFLDPGIGFGKTTVHNLKLLAYLRKLAYAGYPVLVGASRKSLIGNLLDNRPVEGRLYGTIAVHYHALIQGASVLRVHDVRAAVDSIKMFNAINQQYQ